VTTSLAVSQRKKNLFSKNCQKVVKKLLKSWQKVVKKLPKTLSKSCQSYQEVVTNCVAPGKQLNKKKVNRPEKNWKKKKKIIGIPYTRCRRTW
jgi:hypothetical protein